MTSGMQLGWGETQFFDGNGDPLVGGKVYFYVPETETFKDTYQEQALSTPNTNPVILDAAGRATIWGDGLYRQILTDANDVVIWDKEVGNTLETDILAGLGELAVLNVGAGLRIQDQVAPTLDDLQVNFPWVNDNASATVDESYHMTERLVGVALEYTLPAAADVWNGFGFFVNAYQQAASITFIPDPADTLQAAAAGERFIIPGGTQVFISTNGTNAWLLNFFNMNVPAPQGYLTPVNGTPIINSDAVAVSSIYYAPLFGQYCPVRSGNDWVAFPFSNQAIALDAAQHLASNLYDVYAFLSNGSFIVGLGPSWLTGGGNITPGTCARGSGAGSAALGAHRGFIVNANAMTMRNGALTYSVAAGYGLCLGTIAIDPTPGVLTCHRSAGQSRRWGIANIYNPQPVSLLVTDATASWNYSTATIRAANNDSNNNALVLHSLISQGGGIARARTDQRVSFSAANAAAAVGFGKNSLIAFSGHAPTVAAQSSNLLAGGKLIDTPNLGLTRYNLLETGNGTATTTFHGGEVNMLGQVDFWA